MRILIMPVLALTATTVSAQTTSSDPQPPTLEEMAMQEEWIEWDAMLARFIICPGNPRCPPIKPSRGQK